MSYSYTESQTFTVTHARHVASKVATDLLRFQRFYQKPSDAQINNYEAELVALLGADYLSTVTYGFKRDNRWVLALRYVATSGGILISDDDPGTVRPGVDTTGASFSSYLTHNGRWHDLSDVDRDAFEATLPIKRSTADEPGLGNGYWSQDKTYFAGGRGVTRSTFKPYA